MTGTPQDIYLRRIDPSRNMARFYVLSIQPTLFGGSSVVREWGRIGTKGQCKVELLDDTQQAEQIKNSIERSKRRRGYSDFTQDMSPDK
jgi:predicted DNA-binding WGR domain protein